MPIESENKMDYSDICAALYEGNCELAVQITSKPSKAEDGLRYEIRLYEQSSSGIAIADLESFNVGRKIGNIIPTFYVDGILFYKSRDKVLEALLN